MQKEFLIYHSGLKYYILVVLIPVIYICIQYDFSTFVYARSIVRMEMLMVAMIFLSIIYTYKCPSGDY